MSTKLERSNKAHERLMKKYSNIAKSTRDSSSKNFYANVKSRYHLSVLNSQLSTKKILSKGKKAEKYSSSMFREIDDRKYENNYGYYPNAYYIPKKYRDD